MMKNILFIILLGLSFPGFSQQTVSDSIVHDGVQRSYFLHIPATYTGEEAVPLVLSYHGYTQEASFYMEGNDFRPVADTAGFIVVYPQGTLDIYGKTHWYFPGIGEGSTTDDTGFTEDLIDSIARDFNIDLTRVFATGFSNGGRMSYHLACQLSNKFAAIAPVGGSMTPDMIGSCIALHPTPVLLVHGTMDRSVPYEGNDSRESVEDVLLYWVTHNNCNPTAVTFTYPDIDPDDGSTVEHISFLGGDKGVSVEHLKVIGGGHTWPGSNHDWNATNYDINACVEIWKFFSKFDINGLVGATNRIDRLDDKRLKISILPNLTNAHVQITIEAENIGEVSYAIISLRGEYLIEGVMDSNQHLLDVSHLSPNMYFLRIGGQTFKILKTD